jgi:hypothetical protein
MSFEIPGSQAENMPQNADSILRAGLNSADYSVRKSTEVAVFHDRIGKLTADPSSSGYEQAVYQTWPELPTTERFTAFKAAGSMHWNGL